MKFRVLTLAVVASLAVVGCKSNKNKPAAEPTPAVTDLTPAPQPPPQPQQAPVVVEPSTPMKEAPMKEAPSHTSSKEPITGHKYTVKSGDTLYNIAVRKYGSGKQSNISKIEKANPGLKATSLKVGQTITLP